MKVNCESEGTCPGPDKANRCPVKDGFSYEDLNNHVYFTNYCCKFFPKKTATKEPISKRLNLKLCCVCGFHSSQGVTIGQSTVSGYIKAFACERCVQDPNIYLDTKRILPHWTLAIKTQTRKNNFAKDYAKSSEGTDTETAILTNKSKMQVAMSESLYRGQRALEVFS